MIKKIMTLSVLALASVGAAANGFDIEVNYENQRFDEPDVNFDAIGFLVGYRWDFDSDTSGTLEAGLTFGLSDDNISPVIVDLNGSGSIGYRLTQKLEGDWSIYGRAVYADVGISVATAFTDDIDADGGGLGFGGGIMWRGVTAGYTLYTGDLDEYSVFNIGYRWQL
ncbi:MAG: hypothetical protein AB8B97_24630 [Granulosicoccus sp.]